MHRIADDSVLHAIIHIALRERSVVHQVKVVIAQNRLVVGAHETLFDPHAAHCHIALIHIGRAGDDAVEILRKALCFR